MPFQKGNQLGNRNGRPPKPEIEELRKAIKTVEKEEKKKLLVHFVERAFNNDNVLTALLKKIVADVKTIEGNFNIGGQEGNPVGIIVFDGTDTKRKVHKRDSSRSSKRAKGV